jgi:hypothetical protein
MFRQFRGLPVASVANGIARFFESSGYHLCRFEEGRHTRMDLRNELIRLACDNRASAQPISYNIAPSQRILTIRFNPETRARSLDALQWGLIPYWAKDSKIAYRTINARAESVDKAPPSGRLSQKGAA